MMAGAIRNSSRDAFRLLLPEVKHKKSNDSVIYNCENTADTASELLESEADVQVSDNDI